MNDTPASPNFTEHTAEIVGAYVANNHVSPGDMPALIRSVHDTLADLGKPASPVEPEPAKLIPPVSVRKSITDDYLISLEDGRQYQSLKRHLSKHGLTPAEYRAKWGLPADYPMVAPSYARKRSELAKSIGLGSIRRGAAPEPAPAPQPEPEAAAPAPKRGRAKKVA